MPSRKLTPLSLAAITACVCLLVFAGPHREAGSQASEASGTGGGEFVEGRILVKPEPGAPARAVASVNARTGAESEERLPGTEVRVVDLPEDLPVEEAVERYDDAPGIAYAEPDYLLQPLAVAPNDPQYRRMYGLHNTGQTGGTPDADIDAPAAWGATTGDPGTVVAVIDTGVDTEHPDLRDNVWTNVGEAQGVEGVDDDGNGYVDDVHGWDFLHGDATVYDPADGDEHGTHVAGSIAATGDNASGVTGVSWRASIMPLKFIGPNGGSASSAIKAIDYALEKGVRISNNSWGGGSDSQALRDAISRAENAGHLLVAAAGNGGADGAGDDNDAEPLYPASYANANVVSVTATNHRDRLARTSNYGATSVDLAAPGIGILSTLPGGGYGRYSGTSMAAAYVSGTAALLRSRYPEYDAARLKAALLDGAEPKLVLAGRTQTGSRLNAAASLSGDPAPDETKPTIRPGTPDAGQRKRDRTPRIRARITEDRAELDPADVKLSVDGRSVRFEYLPERGLLKATAPRLGYGSHTVRVKATDAAGNTSIRRWSFRVVR